MLVRYGFLPEANPLDAALLRVEAPARLRPAPGLAVDPATGAAAAWQPAGPALHAALGEGPPELY